LGYCSAILYIYADVKHQKYLAGQFEAWRTIPTYLSTILSGIALFLSFAGGVALIIVGAILMWPEMIIVGGALFLFGIVLTLWTISQFVAPDFVKTIRSWPQTTNVLTGIVYLFAAACTIAHIVSVIVVGLNFNGLSYQPSYWLYSVLLGILFEAVIIKGFIFFMDIFGISTLYKFVEIVFYGGQFTAPNPTEMYGVPTAYKVPSGKGTGVIKATGEATFEKGFEEEEFGNLGPVEEEKKEGDVNVVSHDKAEPVHIVEVKDNQVVEEEEDGPKQQVKSHEVGVKQEKVAEVNPSMVNVEDMF
jgi:hypothetical protein